MTFLIFSDNFSLNSSNIICEDIFILRLLLSEFGMKIQNKLQL